MSASAKGVFVTTSHFTKAALDESTHAGKHSITLIDGQRLATMLQMTLDCVPIIFQGEEIGMEDVEIPPEKRNDPFVDKLRDPARTPMQWDDSSNAGFTKKGIEPWLPVADDYSLLTD